MKYLESEKLEMNVSNIRRNHNGLWNYFLQFYRLVIEENDWGYDKRNQMFKPGYDWSKKSNYKLFISDRFKRHCFVKAVIRYHKVSNQPNLRLWRSLDFWYEIRNDIVHSSKGVNRDRLQEVYLKDGAKQGACSPDAILPTMVEMMEEVAKVTPSPKKEALLGVAHSYGVYGQIREWAIATLEE
ncbi:MAG: hypothetical protein F6K29_33455 [Okeania sp. SIO2G5]|nr:hypothetical protein [Okeania sp. SIO2G5]